MIGHEWAVTLLREHIIRKRMRHAYLFTGPRGVGRRTLAIRFAQALNCPQPLAVGEPCRSCRTCMLIEAMQHPDLAVVQAEQEGGTLKVDQVRELQRSLALSPYEATYRIALLLRFEEAHPSAANALLKTLEEPPSKVILLLTAESSESLLPTIVSRCEVLRLRPLPLEVVRQSLQERWHIQSEQADLLAHHSGGRPGYALMLYNSPEIVEQRNTWIEDHLNNLRADFVERFAYAEKIVREKEKLPYILQTWLSLWRDVLLKTAGSSTPITNLDHTSTIEELARRFGLQVAQEIVSAILRTSNMIDRNVNARLAIEVLMLDLPKL